jgi:predicted nucleotidyltransferase
MLDANIQKVFRDLLEITNSLNLSVLLVGVTARILVFDKPFNKEGRSTKDIDVAVNLDNWQVYEELREKLTTENSPDFRATQVEHRFNHIDTNIEIDIVPFGRIGEPEEEVIFPKSGNSMNVTGFIEALEYSVEEKVDDSLKIPVISIPSFIVLKIFAWQDRTREQSKNKDLEDIELILSGYDDERIFHDSQVLDAIVKGKIDYLDAPVYLLGQDIKAISTIKTLEKLDKILSKLMAVIDDQEPVYKKLQVLQSGIYNNPYIG